MPAIHRKQLRKAPETNDNYLSAMPQWFKVVVDYTDVQTAATTLTLTLLTLPKKTFVHAIQWKATGWTTTFSGTKKTLAIQIGDEDDTDRWLITTSIWSTGAGTINIEDGIGLTPWCGDLTNTHDLEVQFDGSGDAEDLTDVTAGTLTIWFLLSSADL